MILNPQTCLIACRCAIYDLVLDFRQRSDTKRGQRMAENGYGSNSIPNSGLAKEI